MSSTRQILRHCFDQKIKCIHHQEESNDLVIETLSAARKLHQLFLINLELMQVVESFTLSEEQFGCTLKSFDQNRLVLVKYSTEYNPDRYDVFIHSWQEFSNPLVHLSNTQILDAGIGWIQIPHPHFENRKLYFDTKEGAQVSEKPISEQPNVTNEIRYPTTYHEHNEYFSWFEKFFSKLEVTPLRQVEHIESIGITFLSYYFLEKGKLSNELIFINSEGNLLDRFVLEQDLQGVGRDTFFVLNQKIFFITNQKTLNIYEI